MAARTPKLTLPVGKLDLELMRGDDREIRLTVSDGSGAPMDLTGAAIRLQMRAKKADDPLLAELSTADGSIEVSDPASGAAVLKFTSSVTESWGFSAAIYDCEFEFPGGIKKTLLAGKVTVTADVTR